jgi:uridine kinase
MDRILIGIAGGSGSGKTTVVRALKERFGQGEVTVLQQDHYYRAHPTLPFEERARINYDHPSAFDQDLLVEHIEALLAGRSIERPIYDFVTHDRSADTVTVNPSHVLIVEGILVLESKALRDLMHMKLFVDTDADVRVLRRLKRDMKERGRSLDEIVDRYLNDVRPMHLQFVEPSKRYADVIFPEGGYNQVALDMLIAKIADLLSRQASAVGEAG